MSAGEAKTVCLSQYLCFLHLDPQSITLELIELISSTKTLNPQIKELGIQIGEVNLFRSLDSFGGGRISAITFPYYGDQRIM